MHLSSLACAKCLEDGVLQLFAALCVIYLIEPSVKGFQSILPYSRARHTMVLQQSSLVILGDGQDSSKECSGVYVLTSC